MKKESKKLILINVGFFFLFLVDRLLKWWAVNSLDEKYPVKFFGIFHFELYFNQGVIFSIALPKVLIFTASILVIVFAVYFLYTSYRKRNFTMIIGISLIISGAFSNLMDRVNHGAIVDFINLHILPVFNLADCMIVAGVIISFLKFNNGINYNEKVH